MKTTIKRFCTFVFIGTAWLFSNVASAELIVFTSEAAFNAATTNRVVETNSAPPNGFIDVHNETIKGITYSNPAFMVDPGYQPELYDWGTGAVLLLGPVTQLGLPSVTAFAADFGTLFQGASIIVTIDGIETEIDTLPRNEFSFYGFVSDTPFTSVSMRTAEQFIILDNITYGDENINPPPIGVPEPSTMALFGIGAALLARRRRPAVS